MLACLIPLGGELELPAIFSDHMVLQRESRVPLWGKAAPGTRLEIAPEWRHAPPVVVTSDAAGRWRAELETPASIGPFLIRITTPTGVFVLRDVQIGEVWIASGQSNMEWTLGPGVGNGVEGWQDAVAESHDPDLRFFQVENTISPVPAEDVHGGWIVAGPESAGSFSAVAYFFAHRLREELDVPVGVITSEWGGTPAEAWMRGEALTGFVDFQPELERLRAWQRDPAAAAREQEARIAAWWRALDEKDQVAGRLATTPVANDELPWTLAAMPASFEQHGLADFDGVVWYKRTVTLPREWSGKDLVVELGPIDDRDTFWWNGERVGGYEEETVWETPRVYRIPGRLVGAQDALAVRVLDTGGYGGFRGKDTDMRVHQAGDEQGSVSLAGPWLWRKSVPMSEIGWPPSREVFDPETPSVLWNGMIAPLVPYTIRGTIWYQGEANRERAGQYRTLFPALIRDWRAAFAHGDFPFYFVQIAPFGYPGDSGEAALLRDAQRLALAVPNTGMAVTMDIGNPSDIHPLEKRQVGERLAQWALAKTYGKERECSGPLYRGMSVQGKEIRIEFEHAAGLTSHDEPVRHVTIAGADRAFHPAVARIEGDALVVASPEVSAPVAVRFGWGAADGTNLWNAAGLPASSFRTDDWP